MNLLFIGEVLAADCAVALAQLVSVQGTVELRRAQAVQWSAAAADAPLCPGDMLRVGARSRAALRLANESTLRLDQDTTLTLGADGARISLIELLRGAFHVITRTPTPFNVRTPFVNAGVEGTEFLVRTDTNAARVVVFEGVVSASNGLGSLLLSSGEAAAATRDGAPRRERVLRPADAVQWALYYPRVVVPGQDDDAALREADALARRGDIGEAFVRMDAVPSPARGARHSAYRAELLLLVGRVDEAQAEIARALAADAGSGEALALQALIAVVQNEPAQGTQLAQRAVEAAPRSAAARLAWSYAQQAFFDIPAALASAQQATEVAPGDALAWARVAELHLALGDLDKALAAAQRASELDAGLAHVRTVLGFAQLTRAETSAARQAFNDAIALDQAAPLPRLGLGLAKIRDGELATGRQDIETAVSLDPLNALMRSYLGKAYYEERRGELAGSQFDLAKALDPKDPTPFFYDAIRQQSENRLVQALTNLERSIALNDNRAVYRSRLLLDHDLAARGASLARIFGDLAFNRLALVEGGMAVASDPLSASAHRFLADAYLSEPRHEIARVSELLQSQLLQPFNVAPIQPQLAEDKSFFLRNVGPAKAGFNEFNPTFLLDRTQVNVDGIVGDQRTHGDQVVVSGIHGRASFSLGQLYLRSDGFGPDAGLQRENYNAFLQYYFSERLHAQIEARETSVRRNTRFFDFDPSLFSNELIDTRNSSVRLGLNLAITPRLQAIFSGIYQRQRETQFEDFLTRDPRFSLFNTLTHRSADASTTEIQLIANAETVSAVSGGGFFSSRTRINSVLNSGGIAIPDPTPNSVEDRSVRNIYSYVYFRQPRYQLQLGLSADDLREPDVERRKLNPKIGLIIHPNPALTLRVAYIKTIKRPLIANQTIEPTQFAGFNQFFDDPNLTISRRTGVALDHKWAPNVFWGAELAQRHLKIPVPQDFPKREKFHRFYLAVAPTPWFAASIGYELEDLSRRPDDPSPEGFVDVHTRRVPLGASFFLGNWAVQVNSSLVDQQATLRIGPMTEPVEQRNRFGITDVLMKYRLPQRTGMLTFGISNLFDKRLRFQEIDQSNPRFAPQRFLFARISLVF